MFQSRFQSFIPPGRARIFYFYFYRLFQFAAPPSGELYADVFKVTSPRFHYASPSSSCIHIPCADGSEVENLKYRVFQAFNPFLHEYSC